MLDMFTLGLEVALAPQNLFYAFIGVLLGTIVGVIPGIGTMSVIAMLLPLTYVISPVSGIIMLAGIYYGAQYGGNTSAILLGIPGESSAAVSVFDGYPMAKKGRAGAALAISALSSFFAGCVSTLLMFLSAPLLGKVALAFASAEYALLMVLGLIGSMSFASGTYLKTMGMVGLGLFLSTVGIDFYTGTPRFEYGIMALSDGFPIAVVAMGVFGIAEVIEQLVHQFKLRRAGGKIPAMEAIPFKSLYPSKNEAKQSVAPASRGTLMGVLLGIFPGIGATIASFAAYSVEKQVNREREELGTGHPAGLAAPEAATNAAAQTSMIPLLTLGIPGSAVVALMMGTMNVHNIQPGPTLINHHPELFFGVIVSMWIGNLMLLVLNLPLIGIWVKLLQVSKPILLPIILVASTLGVYLLNSSSADIVLLLLFGLLGYVMRRFGCSTASFILAFILGPLLEEHLRRALLLSDGSFLTFVERPLSLFLLVLIGGLVMVMGWRSWKLR
jgi:TctA family transporter